MKAVRRLDPLVQVGCGLTQLKQDTQVKEFMSNLSERTSKNNEIYNGDVKKFLIEYHGDRIQSKS